VGEASQQNQLLIGRKEPLKEDAASIIFVVGENKKMLLDGVHLHSEEGDFHHAPARKIVLLLNMHLDEFKEETLWQKYDRIVAMLV